MKDAAAQFIHDSIVDPELAGRFSGVVAGRDFDACADELATLARHEGYEVSEADLREARAEIGRYEQGHDGQELGDAELAEVSGGVFGWMMSRLGRRSAKKDGKLDEWERKTRDLEDPGNRKFWTIF